MGVWDATTPAGSEAISQGDNRIRELKEALAEALSHEDSTFPGASPSTAPIFIPGFLRGATGSRPTGDSLVSGRFYCNTTLNVLERYNGSSWAAVATLIPSGTFMVFFQAAVPTGWTQHPTAGNQLLRVVSGSGGGSGGSTDPGSSISLAHTHTVAGHTHDLANHTHTGPSHTHTVPITGYGHSGGSTVGSGTLVTSDGSVSGANTSPNSGSSGTGATSGPSSNTSGSASPATDSQGGSLALAYINVVIGSKD